MSKFWHVASELSLAFIRKWPQRFDLTISVPTDPGAQLYIFAFYVPSRILPPSTRKHVFTYLQPCMWPPSTQKWSVPDQLHQQKSFNQISILPFCCIRLIIRKWPWRLDLTSSLPNKRGGGDVLPLCLYDLTPNSAAKCWNRPHSLWNGWNPKGLKTGHAASKMASRGLECLWIGLPCTL